MATRGRPSTGRSGDKPVTVYLSPEDILLMGVIQAPLCNSTADTAIVDDGILHLSRLRHRRI